MFYRADAGGQGIGLGLFIVKNAVMALHGTIGVRSEWGIGTTMIVTLPGEEKQGLFQANNKGIINN